MNPSGTSRQAFMKIFFDKAVNSKNPTISKLCFTNHQEIKGVIHRTFNMAYNLLDQTVKPDSRFSEVKQQVMPLQLQPKVRDSIVLQMNVLGMVGQLYDCSDLTHDYLWNIKHAVDTKLERLLEIYTTLPCPEEIEDIIFEAQQEYLEICIHALSLLH